MKKLFYKLGLHKWRMTKTFMIWKCEIYGMTKEEYYN